MDFHLPACVLGKFDQSRLSWRQQAHDAPLAHIEEGEVAQAVAKRLQLCKEEYIVAQWIEGHLVQHPVYDAESHGEGDASLHVNDTRLEECVDIWRGCCRLENA